MRRLNFGETDWFRTRDGREVRKICESGCSTLIVQDPLRTKPETLSIFELEPPDVESRGRVLEALELPKPVAAEAQRRYQGARSFLDSPFGTLQAALEAAQALGVSVATIYRMRTRYRAEPGLVALVPARRGPQPGRRMLPEQSEALLDAVLREYHFVLQRPTIQATCLEVRRVFRQAGLPPPSDGTVKNRIRAFGSVMAARTRRGRAAAQRLESSRGHFDAGDWPLARIQIDHTLVDLEVVDGTHRRVIGRPWVTLAIDCYSRMVVGFYISFEAPSATSVGLCLAHAILDKEEWLKRYATESPWPVWGVPDRIHVDNGREFHSAVLAAACQELGVHIEYRPPGRSHFGGHIERLNGTMMGKIHICPGTTFSNPRERGSYPSEKLAAMTLEEFEAWFTVQVVDLYHNTRHRSLGMSPLAMWEQGIRGDGKRPGRHLPDRILDVVGLRRLFLPMERRTVQRMGITWDDLRYWDGRLAHWTLATDPEEPRRRRSFVVRRDPRDLKVIHFFDPELKEYLEIPLAHSSAPAMTIWDLRQVRRVLKEAGETEITSDRLIAGINRQREIEENARIESRKARKSEAQRKHAVQAEARRARVEPADALAGPEPAAPPVLAPTCSKRRGQPIPDD